MNKNDLVRLGHRHYRVKTVTDSGVVYCRGGAVVPAEQLTVVDPPFAVGETVQRNSEYFVVTGFTPSQTGGLDAELRMPGHGTYRYYAETLKPVHFWELVKIQDLERGDYYIPKVIGRDVYPDVSPDCIRGMRRALDIYASKETDARPARYKIMDDDTQYVHNDYIWRQREEG